MNHLSINAVRSEALFVSTLQRSDNPSAGQIQDAVAAAVREFGSRGCAERVAQEFGDHPEVAVERMRWARRLIEEAFRVARLEAVHRRLLASPTLAHGSCAA